MNRLISRLRRIAPVVIIAAMLTVMASCTASKRYGCPESMNISSVTGH